MAKRERNHQINVYLNDAELDLLKQRCSMHHENVSQIIRELIVFGFNYSVDNSDLFAVCNEINAIGKNINQIAKHANESGSVYTSDIEEVKGKVDEIWRLLRSTLSRKAFKKQ